MCNQLTEKVVFLYHVSQRPSSRLVHDANAPELTELSKDLSNCSPNLSCDS